MDPATLSATVEVRLHHTDAAGVIVYPRLLEIEEELFERWLEAGGMHLREMLVERTLPPTPVVRCEADYRAPVRIGDRLAATIASAEIGQTSFTLSWSFACNGRVAMQARVTRAAIDPVAVAGVNLAPRLRAWLGETQARIARR